MSILLQDVEADDFPVLDLAGFAGGVPGSRQRLARDLADALENIGFLVVVNHGVPAQMIGSIFAEAARLHAMPLQRKMALAMGTGSVGYLPAARFAIKTSEVNNNRKPDLNEAFFIDRERSPEDPEVRAAKPFRELNKWPADLPGFRERAVAYYARLEGFAKSLLPVFATALDLPPDWFDAPFTNAQCTLRLSHYPASDYEDNQFGIAPHTDSSFLTILPQSNLAGLYIRPAGRGWMKAPNIPGSFIVNAGDHVPALEQRPIPLDRAPRDQSDAGPRPLRRAVLLRAEHRLADQVPAQLLQRGQSAALSGGDLRAVSALVPAQQLPRGRRCPGDDGQAIGSAASRTKIGGTATGKRRCLPVDCRNISLRGNVHAQGRTITSRRAGRPCRQSGGHGIPAQRDRGSADQPVAIRPGGRNPGSDDDHRSGEVAEEIRRGADAGRAGEGRQTAAGRAARSRRTAGVAAAERDRQIRRHLAARVHRTGGRRERQPHPVVRQAAALERGRQQDRALRRQGLRTQRRRQDLHAVSCARA